ncbi:DUF2214 family protein [Brevundimonas sp. S30B]|uniref:DUF2214 family protein n=1 Tax=unclassified Brevundimonas TaxID=2622653 RepID=UPI00107255FC|nr:MULTISPECIES: DUF2214 family protein [unclassified Brevundimonas]QBX37578.1 DUF2214 family protein [Brevundimonas sp. MF30-B]TFW03629.1 DUF2214 family protein [Brevundimonas sp. S30B]
MPDLLLAILHHVLVFGLFGMVVLERALVAAPVIDARRLARIDAGVGMTSALVLGVGVARVVWGGKGWAFYEANPFFWAKLATFMLIGLLSIGPTLSFLRWAKSARDRPDFQPAAVEITTTRNRLGIMALMFVPLVSFAAAMARWPF